MTLEEIKAAVKAGIRVYWRNDRYEVIEDSDGQWFICDDDSESYIGLTWSDGVTMNGDGEDFYIEG